MLRVHFTLRFALEVAQKTLPFYKEYFQVAYPLPKIDLIAIADFAAGMFCGCVKWEWSCYACC